MGELEKERGPEHNPEVVGSNPAPATKNLQLVGLAGELFCYPGTGVANLRPFCRAVLVVGNQELI